MQIINGKIESAERVLIYGTEGIGKSTLASQFPTPLFIDTEGSTNKLDVQRFERPTSWSMLKEQVKYVYSHPEICRTLIIDTVDWAERLCLDDLCARNQWDSIETPGYGKGFTMLAEEFGRFLNFLYDLALTKGIHIVLVAHADIKQTELPEETGKYEFWTLKLQKKTSPLLKEWADVVLFCNYKTLIVQDGKSGTAKAVGGQRFVYTTHRTTWDAKNRHGLPEEIEMDYAKIAHIFDPIPPQYEQNGAPAPASAPAQEEPSESPKQEPPEAPPIKCDDDGVIIEDDTEFVAPDWKALNLLDALPAWKAPPIPAGKEYIKPLYDLMEQNHISDMMIREVAMNKGWITRTQTIENFPQSLVEGALIAGWDKLTSAIETSRREHLPF